MDLQEALLTALDFEKKGMKIYEKVSLNTKNPIIAKTFKYLAKQEVNHIHEIEKYIKSNKIEIKGDQPKDTEKFFSTTIQDFKTKTELSEDDLKAHEVALELEHNSYDFYKEQKEKTNNQEMKSFFEFLMKQENAHFKLIQKAYEFIKDPESFFRDEEKWMFEGA